MNTKLCSCFCKYRWSLSDCNISLRNSPQWARASSFTRFLDHTQRRTTVGRTPLEEWSARRRELYLKSYSSHIKQTSMAPVGFESTILAGERPQTYALPDRNTKFNILIDVSEVFLVEYYRI